ncbi:MAG: hypothetical protein HDR24_08645 [Lachnospiraceae bacterium]|nr:hypothetical protein [Lachnospiraceae bacterium]
MNLNDLKGKKLLVLSGVGSHMKVVDAAHELGIYVIVADYLEPSLATPAKFLADENWSDSVLDIDTIVGRCRKEHVDGIISCNSDITQIPYCRICNELELPCYGNEELFLKMSNKSLFKDICRKYELDVIEEYSSEDIQKGTIKYPVFVKPVDGMGSKGQSICNHQKELEAAVLYAQQFSRTKEILIERYVANTNSFQVTYFFMNGEAYLLRTADGYKGECKDSLDRVALCSLSPSVYTDEFIKKANDKFIKMLKDLGYKNGPAMVQAFYENGVFRFYDPGLRFPGTDFELILKEVYGIDFMKAMVIYAMTGMLPELNISNEICRLNGKKAAVLYPTLGEGEISAVFGLEDVKTYKNVCAINQRYQKGDYVQITNTTRQRLAEIDVLCENMVELKETIKSIQRCIDAIDSEGNSLLYMPFDVDRLP